ncbi:ORF6N domain protein [Clostridium saccharobutylicum]|uniref:ORF6N domain-containing protein n=1 Tax=Clostridium saccharobutylicum TaxID=169679 RepID=UPI000983E5D8|nr:ORF6N domain-containing protein [Clostridium saccharobutylicum]AQS10612.1 ORF6N domain protein [Clostridium saccharobutylicum]MBC2438036.1 ORF6N domain-containing protein [Clostridium saccharobutylicum]NSB90512.1 hypothetical protein [Clostridium saccharobutylicum]NYC31567.1 hypothetical protein [Clostridium saccharobutylicum]OOM18885.1 ORF6N domain protein [Clostridium saccharobutylicum]
MNNLITINNRDLQIKEFNGQRVVTLKDIDTLHQRPEGTSRRNFNKNKKHLIVNEDYFVRNSYEAKEEFGITAPSGLTLLTESGYLMLVKSLTDDLAWEVQRQLVNSYFRVKNDMPIVLGIASQMLNLAQGTQVIGQVVQGLMQTVGGIKEYVQDSIQAKDHQIDQAMNLIGIRSKNTRRLSKKLKDALFNKYDEYVYATDIRYINAMHLVFKEFKVYKWEEISVTQYNAVEAFIENMFD